MANDQTRDFQRPLLVLPAVVVAVAALSAGAAMGRKYLKGEVNKRKQSAIVDASAIVKTRINEDADIYIRRSLSIYIRNMAIKLALLSIIVAAALLGWVSGVVGGAAMAALFLAFLAYDTVKLWPNAMLVLGELRRHKWRPRIALAEIVAANVFDQVLAEAKARETDLWSEIAMRLSGQNAGQVSQEIAVSVAEIARQTSWEDLRPYLISGAIKFAGVMLLYSSAVFLLVKAMGS